MKTFAIGALSLILMGAALGAVSSARADATQANAQLCVIVPHFKDEYWLSVGHGLNQEAKQQDVELIIFESGGYHALDQQIQLLDVCSSQDVSAILIGAVSADSPRLLAAIKRISQDVPIVALVNELRSPDLSASVGVSWRDMGLAIGRYLTQAHPAGSPRRTASLITGPAESGWSPLLEGGIRDGLLESAVDIEYVGHSDTGLREQLIQVETALAEKPDADILIGTAPAIEGAMGLAANSQQAFPQLVATYISHSVRRGLQNGTVQAVAFDDPVEQGRLGVTVGLAVTQNRVPLGMIGPRIKLVTAGSEAAFEIGLSPADLQLSLE